MATFAFALAAEHFHRRHRVGFRTWLLFFGLEIGIHLFLDVFNAYGTGLFEPFSHARISFNVVFVADPFISIWPAMAFVALLILKRWDPRRRTWWRLGVFLPALYLVFCLFNKYQINRDSKMILLKQHMPFNRYFTTPTPLNNLLWYVVAGNDTGFYIGYRSVLDTRNRIDFQYYPRNDSLLDPLAGHEELQHLIRFSKGYYTVEKWNDTLVFNDLRFGQIVGWYDPRERFVFHYFLQHPPASNKMVVQRGRFAGWNAKTFRALLKRIRGN